MPRVTPAPLGAWRDRSCDERSSISDSSCGSPSPWNGEAASRAASIRTPACRAWATASSLLRARLHRACRSWVWTCCAPQTHEPPSLFPGLFVVRRFLRKFRPLVGSHSLDGSYAALGCMLEGGAVLDAISAVPPRGRAGHGDRREVGLAQAVTPRMARVAHPPLKSSNESCVLPAQTAMPGRLAGQTPTFTLPTVTPLTRTVSIPAAVRRASMRSPS